jgi:tRNA A-37 threonylcarbamoyl transferase component Bud32
MRADRQTDLWEEDSAGESGVIVRADGAGGTRCFADFANLPGVIVSGHPDRHVMRVELPDGSAAYLKKEHIVRRKERFRQWRAGFGWASKSTREALTLKLLEELGIPAPRWLAHGESRDGQAFLLLEPTPGIDLRRGWRVFECRRTIGHAVGRFIGRLHRQGIDHPDLHAKHLIIDGLSVTALDWQRTRIGRSGGFARGLAVTLASAPERDEQFEAGLFAGYEEVAGPVSAIFSWRVERAARKLRSRGKYREQHQPPLAAGAQNLVWLDGEALCVVPGAVGDLSRPELRGAIGDRQRDGAEFELSDGRTVQLRVGRHRAWLSRAWEWFRGRSWRSPELRVARLLFHLQRFGAPARRLVAYGQRARGATASAFVLAEKQAETPWADAFAPADDDERHLLLRQLSDALARLHEAGYRLGSVAGARVERAEGGMIVTIDHTAIRRDRRMTGRRRRDDWQAVGMSMTPICRPREQAWFLDRFAESAR